MSNRIKAQNVNPKTATQTLKNKCNYRQILLFVSKQDDHDTSHETYLHAHRPNKRKNYLSHATICQLKIFQSQSSCNQKRKV